MKYKRAITKADFLVTLICVIMAFLNLGGLSSAGRERARRMVCAVNMARLAQANHIYADNWDEQFCPPMMEDRTMPSTPTDERKKTWITNNDFQKYIAIDIEQLASWDIVVPKEYQCPSNIIYKKDRVSSWGGLASYAYNVTDWNGGHPDSTMNFYCFWTGTTNCCLNAGTDTWQIGWKRTEVKHASEKINFTESCDWWAKWRDGANYIQGWDIVGHGNWDDYSDIGYYGPTLYRHNEGANFAFYDGHVEYLPKEKACIDVDGSLTDYDTEDATGMWYVLYPD